MTFLKRRDRVLIFRLTQDEYQQLSTACQARGARNLSDFARSELLALLEDELHQTAVEDRLSHVEEQLQDLNSSVRRVTEMIEEMKQTNGGPEAA